jgi:hypothetical protein
LAEVELRWLLYTLPVPVLADELRDAPEFLGLVVLFEVISPALVGEVEKGLDALTVVPFEHTLWRIKDDSAELFERVLSFGDVHRGTSDYSFLIIEQQTVY